MRSRCSISRRLSRREPVLLSPEGWLSRRTPSRLSTGLRTKLLRNRITMWLTILRGRDRTGHGARIAALALLAWLLPLQAVAQRAGDYKAQRFDVVITPHGADLDVVETIVFEFQSGIFRRVWRDIPSSRTDGVEILEARMDGAPLPRGEGEGQVEVSGRNRVKVQWNFAPTGPSVHTFELRYRVRGVIYRADGADVLRFRVLPNEHRYAIDASRILFAATGAEPRPLEARRIGSSSISATADGVVIEASNIARNGTAVAELRYPAGTMISAPPAWQQRDADARASAPKWLLGAAAVFALGVIVVLGARQGYEPPRVPSDETTTTSPPGPMPAALAAVLVNKGRASAYQGVATLLDLAERGVLRIQEVPKGFGIRSYDVTRVPGLRPLEPHEQSAIDIAFGRDAETTTLGKARGRLARASRKFVAAINGDLARRGFLDPARQAARDRLTGVAIAMLIASALGTIACAPLIPRYEAWPFAVPLALMLAGIIGIVVAASMSPLSDQGTIEAARWRGFKRYLEAVASAGKGAAGMPVETRWIVYGIAVGLATQWSRYLKSHPGAAPPWFSAASADNGAAFATFVGSNAATTGAHGGGSGGGGAAGGGGSGAG